MRARRLVLGLGAALLMAAARATPINIAMPSGPVSLPLLVAIEKHLFQAEGLEVVRLPCSSGKACLAALRSGAADLAASAEFAVAMTAAQTPAVAILASIGKSTAQIKLIASRRAGVRDSASISGKRIAIVAGTSGRSAWPVPCTTSICPTWRPTVPCAASTPSAPT